MMKSEVFFSVLLLLGSHSNGLPIAEEERELWERYLTDRAFSMPTVVPSQPPVRQTILFPTVAPALRTETTPTMHPTLKPVVVRSSEPTVSPASSRTLAPLTSKPVPTSETSQPTSIELRLPTIPPSLLRTSSPTQSASDFPSDLSSDVPSMIQPMQPTSAPSMASSLSSDECVLQVNTTCSVQTGPYAGQQCDNVELTTITCTAPPTNLTFQYTAQACNDSSTNLDGYFSCVDGTMGTTEEAYVVASSGKEGAVLFRGWVQNGQYLSINTGDDGERLPDVVLVKLFGSNETSNPANLAQEFQFPASCNINLRLKDQLGALQLKEFSSPEQGDVSCLVPITTTVNIGVAEESGGTDTSLTSLELLSNNAGLKDFSDLVAGIALSPGESVDVELPSELLDLSERRTYTDSIQITAVSNPSGIACEGTAVNSFVAGAQVSPFPDDTIPSASPSSLSSIDGTYSECTISATIVRECLSDGGISIGPCDQIPDPRGKACADDAPATGLVFLYRGFDNVSVNPREVRIQVTSNSNLTESNIVTLGGTFRVDGTFGGSLQVSVSNIDDNGNVGTELDSFTLDTTCSSSNPSLSLTSPLGLLGALELVAFENELGDFSSLTSIRLLYSIENIGDGELVAESAIVESEFLPDSLQVLEEQVVITRGEELLVFSETSQVNIGTKFSDNVRFMFALNAEANASMSVSGRGCRAETAYSF
ncbi:hypothetical protein FisN_10Lh021 [Fistulifera solaris]|uniref:DUF7467 domain-containing protein n=1 Tax=Fistulifera solaris TaxID=1519565 RepID=A0A1Z5JT23_FISSO|nr:hypothetical protein FisN_10Lh021 [Fistulifera solaris]|eukprot:GAX17174.1 hypothetical protein FisN_10Lh021 [Fistulifera solaris]